MWHSWCTQNASNPCGNNPNHVPFTHVPRPNGPSGDEKIHLMRPQRVNHSRYAVGYANSRDTEGHAEGVALLRRFARASR